MVGRRIKRKAAKDSAATKAQQKAELLEKKRASLAKARAAKARKFQQRQKKKKNQRQEHAQMSATATARAAAGPAGPTATADGGGSLDCDVQQKCRRSPENASGGESAGPGPAVGRGSDPGLEDQDSTSRDDVLEHAAAAQEEAVLLRQDEHQHAMPDQQSNEKRHLGGKGDDRPFIPSGVLVGHRILRSFGDDDGSGPDGCFVLRSPTSEEAEEVDSALFIGTVMSYRPPKVYEDLMPRNDVEDQNAQDEVAGNGGRRKGRKKKKKRMGRPRKDAVRELDYALYRVQFDDGDVMDMEPKEVFQCSQLYDAKREEIIDSSSEYTGPPPMIMGKDHDDPHQPANLASGLREIARHANPSCDSLLADPTTLRALDTEIQGYWVQYRVHHIQRGIPRPPSMLSDEEHSEHRAAMAPFSHHRSDDAVLLSPFANNFDHEDQLGVVDGSVDTAQGSDVLPPPAFDFHDDVPRTPGGSLSLDKPSHTPSKRAVSQGICEEEDGKPAARRHRHQLSDSSMSARRSAPARGREDVSIVSDDDSSHCTEDALEVEATAASAQSLNVREAPSVSPEHTGPESPQASCTVAETLPSPNPNQDLPQDTEHDAHVESQPSLHLDEDDNNASSQQEQSPFVAPKETGPSSSGSDTMECVQEETPSVPCQTNPDEEAGTSVASTFSHAFNGKLYGFEKRVSHQHRRMKKPKAQGRARFPVLPLASRKRKQGPCTPSDEFTEMTSAATDTNTVTPSPVGRSLQKVTVDEVDLPNLAPAGVASPVVGGDETADVSKYHTTLPDHEPAAVQKQISLPNESCKTSCDDDLAASSPSDEVLTAKPNRNIPTIQVPEGEQIEMSETPRDSEHSATMHEFAEIMAAPSPARASVTFAASVKEAVAEELPTSSDSACPNVAAASPETATAGTAPLADTAVGRIVNGEDGAHRQNYSILSRAYAVGPGLHRSRGPDIHVVLSAVYEPLSSQSSTKVDSDATTSGVLPSLQMQQSQDSASRYMSSDYRYKAEVADDSRISSLPNITRLAEGLAKKYSLSGEWSARIDLVLSVEGNGLPRWPGTPSVDRYTAVSVMSGFLPERFPADIRNGVTSIVAAFKEGRVVDITKGHLRGQRGVVRKVIRPDKLLVMVIESGHEKEHLIIATDARQLSQEEVVKSLLQGPNKDTYGDMNMSDLDHAMGSPNPRSRNEDFLADVDYMLNEELHEIDAVSAMNMFPPGDPGRVSTFVPTSAALSALKASPYSADGRAVRRRRAVRKPKGQGGRRRKSNVPSSGALSVGDDASGGTTKKKRDRKRKNDNSVEPSTTKRRGRKPVSDDDGSNSLNRTTDGTKRRGRKPSTSTARRGRPCASKDDARSPTMTKSRRGRAPRIAGESTTRIKIRQSLPGKVSDEESVGVELQLPVPKRQRRGNHWKAKAAQPLPVPKEPAVQKAALDRVETMLRKKAERMKGTEKWDKVASGVSHGKGDISVHTWGLLALLGVFEMRNAVSSLGYKPVGNKIDMLGQLSAAYENLGLEMPKVDV